MADRTGIPVTLTLLGLGAFPASHPLNLGMMGMHGEAWVNHRIQDADLLIALGMRFRRPRDRQSDRLTLPKARKIQVEIDSSEINKNVKVDVALIGDLREVLRELLPRLQPIDCSEWRSYIDELKGDAGAGHPEPAGQRAPLLPRTSSTTCGRNTAGADTVVVTDVGQHQMWEAQYFKHEVPRSLITSGGLGTMGFALPAAIGVKVARPEAEVWVVVGDGGFQMTMAELATMVQEKLKIHIAIINNGYLVVVRRWATTTRSAPLLTPIMRSSQDFQCSATVTNRSQVVPAVESARRREGPMLIDFHFEHGRFGLSDGGSRSGTTRMVRPNPLEETAGDQSV